MVGMGVVACVRSVTPSYSTLLSMLSPFLTSHGTNRTETESRDILEAEERP